jgi:hypothetical protein
MCVGVYMPVSVKCLGLLAQVQFLQDTIMCIWVCMYACMGLQAQVPFQQHILLYHFKLSIFSNAYNSHVHVCVCIYTQCNGSDCCYNRCLQAAHHQDHVHPTAGQEALATATSRVQHSPQLLQVPLALQWQMEWQHLSLLAAVGLLQCPVLSSCLVRHSSWLPWSDVPTERQRIILITPCKPNEPSQMT